MFGNFDNNYQPKVNSYPANTFLGVILTGFNVFARDEVEEWRCMLTSAALMSP